MQPQPAPRNHGITEAPKHFDMITAPMRIGRVRLKVRDLEKVSAFYQSAMGLSPIRKDDGRVTLGTGRAALLEPVADPSFLPGDKRQTGLFHTAFIMPTRADLARWLGLARRTGLRLQGASDHIVSKAIYLSEPEGNGIEVYVDRAVSNWHDTKGNIQMATNPLDFQDLLKAAGDKRWVEYPQDGSIGPAIAVGLANAAARVVVLASRRSPPLTK
jgi:catechol 2,3-dioxygenase